MFTKKDLKNGMFGMMHEKYGNSNEHYLFVIVNDLIVYQNGGSDIIDEFNNNLTNYYDKYEYIEELRWATSFDVYDYGEIIFDRKKDYKPILMNEERNEEYGNIGDITSLTGAFGEKLYIGDIVEIYNTEDNKVENKAYVVFNHGEYFVMGLSGLVVDNGNASYKETKNILFQVRKIKSYKNIVNGEKYGVISAVGEV